ARARHDRGHGDFAPVRVGDAEDGGLADPGMLEEAALDLGREDVLPPALDHLLHAPGDVEEALVVERTEGAGVHPAAAQRARGRPGYGPVAEHVELAATDDLARRPGRDGAIVAVDDTHVDVQRRAADGRRLAEAGGGTQRRDGARLRLAVLDEE